MSEKPNYRQLAGIRIDQYWNAHNPTKFGACIKNRTIEQLCRRTIINGVEPLIPSSRHGHSQFPNLEIGPKTNYQYQNRRHFVGHFCL